MKLAPGDAGALEDGLVGRVRDERLYRICPESTGDRIGLPLVPWRAALAREHLPHGVVMGLPEHRHHKK